jgi:hypothetical protein
VGDLLDAGHDRLQRPVRQVGQRTGNGQLVTGPGHVRVRRVLPRRTDADRAGPVTVVRPGTAEVPVVAATYGPVVAGPWSPPPGR